MQKKIGLQHVTVILLGLTLSSCGFVTGQLKDQANESELLKSGSLDAPVIKQYETYSYKMLGKYQVSHDWLSSADPCHYKAIYSKTPTHRAAKVIRDGDIYEANGHTYQEFYQPEYPERSQDLKFLNIDRYTRPEWTVSGYQGKPVTNKGFDPICSQSWLQTQHVLAIELRKQSADDLIATYKKFYPDVVFNQQQVNHNKWLVKVSELRPDPPLNGAGGPFQTWILPIADTGYIFVFVLGANQDSLQYSQAHARMQQIFKHLIESVKIEPLPQ